MPYDSSTYVGRNLIRLPFVVVRNIDIAKDWSTITFTGKLLGESLNVPFVAPLEWYLDRQMKINREVAMFEVEPGFYLFPEHEEVSPRYYRIIEVEGLKLLGLMLED